MSLALLLVPDPAADEAQWQALADVLSGRLGARLLFDGTAMDADAIAAHIDATRANGDCHVVVVAGGGSALEALLAADALDSPPGLVLLSPADPADDDYMSYRGEGASKLLLADSGSVEIAEQLARASIGWTATVTFPTDPSDSDLLETWFDHVVDQVEGFVAQEAASACAKTARSNG